MSSISGSIKFTGLGSGTDFESIVDQLMEIESIHMNRLESWKSQWEAKMESMQGLNSRLAAVAEAAGAMDTISEFKVKQAATSDSSIITALGTNNANEGAYSIEVGQNVKHIVNSAGVAGTTSLVAANLGADTASLVFSIDGTTYTTAALDNTTTLNDLKNAIEAVVGAAAEVEITDDGTSSNPYRLQITSGTGGAAGEVTIIQNPTDLSLDNKNSALNRYGAAWTGTATAATAGQFTGDSATADVWTYSFTMDTGGGAATVGTDSFDITWTADAGGGSGTITVPADYATGDILEVENGLFIKLEAGDVNDGEQFHVTAYANNIDDAEADSWSGAAITTSGNYLGSVNKTYSFAVVQGGELDTDKARVLRWTDSTGRTGTVSITDSDTAYEVDQGVKVSFAAGELADGQTFTVNVFAPDKQKGQDSGLAQAAKVVHAGFSDDTTSAVTNDSGFFTYTYAGQQVSVSVDGGSTLSQLVNMINNDANNPGVSASIINDGTGLPTSYKLVLTGTDSGAAYQITSVSHTFTGSAFSLEGEIGGGFSITQEATNAMIRVDGFPADEDEYLQRDENALGDVVEGVAIELHDVGKATVTVSTNLSAVAEQIEKFVNAVNFALEFIAEETAYNATSTRVSTNSSTSSDDEIKVQAYENENGIMMGNYSYYMLKSTLNSIMGSSVSGLDGTLTAYTHLSQIGIESDPENEGQWSINTSTLSNALTNDLEAVADLFTYSETFGTDGVAKKMYDKMEEMTDDETGILSVLLDNYQGIVDNIDDKIGYEEKRIALYRDRMSLKFSRLEATLAVLEKQSESVDAAIASLPDTGSSSK